MSSSANAGAIISIDGFRPLLCFVIPGFLNLHSRVMAPGDLACVALKAVNDARTLVHWYAGS